MFSSSKGTDIAMGMGIGIAVGSVAAYAGSKMMGSSGRRAYRKTAAKCMKSMENVLDTISSMAK